MNASMKAHKDLTMHNEFRKDENGYDRAPNKRTYKVGGG